MMHFIIVLVLVLFLSYFPSYKSRYTVARPCTVIISPLAAFKEIFGAFLTFNFKVLAILFEMIVVLVPVSRRQHTKYFVSCLLLLAVTGSFGKHLLSSTISQMNSSVSFKSLEISFSCLSDFIFLSVVEEFF